MRNIIKSRFFISPFIAFAIPVFLLSGCVTDEDLGRLQWDINNVKTEVNRLKEAQPESYQKTEIDAKINSVMNKQKNIEEKQDATSRTLSDLLIQVQNLTSEFQVMTGRFEESRYFSEKSSAELLESKDKILAKQKEYDAMLLEMQTSINELKKTASDLQTAIDKINKERAEEKAAIEAEKRRRAAEAAAKKKKAAKAKKLGVKEVYMAGYEAFKDGRLEEARKKFSSVLKDFGINEYTDNARFWIAESYYKEGNYEDAILAYEELFKNHPKSEKIPGAMLKQGLAFYALKDKKTGRIILEKLIEKYPHSEQAKLAKKKITKPSPPKKKKS